MNRHSFSLSSIGMSKGRAQVKLDGEDISDAVNGIGLDFSARDHPRVMLELFDVSADVAVDDAEIQLPQKVVELLGRLGWTAPNRTTIEVRERVGELWAELVSGGDLPTYDEIASRLDMMLNRSVPTSDVGAPAEEQPTRGAE